jgi:hypothetical protein
LEPCHSTGAIEEPDHAALRRGVVWPE